MAIHQPVDEVPVAHHTEASSPSSARAKASRQRIRRMAAGRRALVAHLTRLVYALLGSLELLLFFRFILKAIAADPDHGVGAAIYRLTAPLVAPFVGLLPTPWSGGVIIETTTLIAMAVYALLVWGVCHALATASAHPPVTFTRVRPKSVGGATEDPSDTIPRD